MKILYMNGIFSLKIKPVSHMILVYVSLNKLFCKCSCFNVEADISISSRYLESASNIFSNAVMGLSNTDICNKRVLP